MKFEQMCEGMNGDIALIGIGDFGGETLPQFRFKDGSTPLLVRLNWQDRFPMLDGEMIHVSLDEDLRGVVLGDPISAGKATASVAPEVIALLPAVSFVILVAQPGDGVGSGGTIAMADALKRAEIPFLTILALPDADSVGRKRHMTARSTISDLCVMKEAPVVFDQAEFPGYYNAFRLSVIEKVQTLLDVLTPSMIPMDFNRIRTALTGSGANAVATAKTMGKSRAVEAVENILADPTVERFLGSPASVLLHLQSDESLSLYEIDEIANAIIDNWGADVDLTYGVGQGGCRKSELRLGLIVSEYIPEMDYEMGIEDDPRNDVDALMSEAFTRLQAGSAL